MKELSDKEIKMYNYIKVKDFVDNELSYLSHLGTKLFCLLPPGASRKISFMEKVDCSPSNSSSQERFVEKKDELERKIKNELNKYNDNFRIMTKDELIAFEELYIYQATEENIEEKTGWSRNKLVHMKKSFMIKFALSMGADFEK